MRLDAIESQGTQPPVLYYRMVMECLGTSGEIVAGFALLARVEACGLLSSWDENCYPMFRTLLETCWAIGDSEGASRVLAWVDRLGLEGLCPTARVLQGSERRHKDEVSVKSFAAEMSNTSQIFGYEP